MWTEKNSDASILLNYVDDEYSQGYDQIKEPFRAVTQDDKLQSYIKMTKSDHRMLELMMLLIIYKFLLYNIRKSSQLPNHLM